MKTLVISFKKRTSSGDLSYEREFIDFLNGYTLYADKLLVLSKNDDNGLIEALSSDYDLAFLLNGDAAFGCMTTACSNLGLTFDADGFCTNGKILSVVPKNFQEDYPEKLEKIISEKFSVAFNKITFKLYGVKIEKVLEVCGRISDETPSLYFNVSENFGDIKVNLIYGDLAPKKTVDKGVREFIFALKNHIYAEDDVSLEKRLYDVVKLRKQKICTAESMTGGRIASKIVSVDGASDIFYEGLVTYDTLAKERRIGVNHSTVNTYTVVSKEVAYEMAKGLLQGGNCTIAITVTGYAGSSVNPSDDDGLCYIGVGVKDKIQVYEYKFSGSRTENIENATNAAIFLAVKTVENLDGL